MIGVPQVAGLCTSRVSREGMATRTRKTMRLGNLKISRRMSLLVMLSVIGLLVVSTIDAWRTRGVLL